MKTLKTQTSCGDINPQGTLHIDQALKNMLDAVSERNDIEFVPLLEATDRILATSIVSPINVPAHRNSAVDGYAIHSSDLPKLGETKHYEVIATAVAGHPYKGTIENGQTVQIMTGAQMPEQADTVIMLEHVEKLEQSIRIDDRHSAGQNVRQAGEDMQQGQTVLASGCALTPPRIGLLASLGFSEITVKRQLRVAVFSTGDEILNTHEAAREGCIYDSNRYSMISALKKIGCDVLDMGIIPDDPEKLESAFLLAADNADVVFTSGGVSVGEADYTKQVLSKTGSINFWKVAIKPGRPIAFGHVNDSVFFGLPGNPVAVMVTFYQFALPTLQKIMGLSDPLLTPTIKARSLKPMRKLANRTEISRGILCQGNNGEWNVSVSGKQGSGILRSMSDANAFIILEHDRESVEAGEWVTTQPFCGLF